MSKEARKSAWQKFLRARFGDTLDGKRLRAVLAQCEALYAIWGPMAEMRPDNAAPPFADRLSDPRGGEDE